ncbi:MAG: hypothetical protein ACI857_002899, partial [Arenicella sp.]
MRPDQIKNKKVIIAPLDWGMGHVTRSLALISELLVNQNEIIFAGTEEQIDIAKQDFPKLIFELIAGYDISLDSKKSTYWQMLSQSAKMAKSIKREAEVANELSDKYEADIIISDNRYGFKSAKCANIFLTHQLSPPVPKFQALVSNKIVKWVNEFDLCWIPDSDSEPLCQELHDTKLKIPKVLIGTLSRLKFESREKKNEILFISSGPEPERSRFENLMIGQLDKVGMAFKVVGQNQRNELFYCINPSASELQNLINESNLIICKAGY